MAPISKKSGAKPVMKTTPKPTKDPGSSSKKSSSSGSKTETSFSKSSNFSTGKGLPSSGYSKPKSSTSFGVIWLPTRKHNRQKKDKVYESYKDDYKSKKYPHNYFMADEHKVRIEDESRVRDDKAGAVATTAAMSCVANSTVKGDKEQAVGANSTNLEGGNPFEGVADEPETGTLLLKPKEQADSSVAMKECKVNMEDEKTESVDDNMDGVYVKKAAKPAASTSSVDDTVMCDQHVIDCLYFSMQCCECTIS